jgi:hypothetical protein
MRRAALLGPQRFRPCVAAVLDELGCRGTLAVVTAGWQEREEEVDELRAHVGRDVVNLQLYARNESALADDPELAAALRRHQEELQALQELYRLRLTLALRAVVELEAREGPLAVEERREALRAVRVLDRRHLARIRRERAAFEARMRPGDRRPIALHRKALARALERASALAIAGGHVAVLLNRLRLFAIHELAPALPIVAWSAGAMALSERVVLFHDDPPQGAGHAEILDIGLAVCPRVVPLPHASRRLRLGDAARVGRFAERFAPAVCLALDGGEHLAFDGREWRAGPGVRRLGFGGAVEEVSVF